MKCSWNDGPHSEAVDTLRRAAADLDARARKIADAHKTVTDLYGPAGLERLLGDSLPSAWADQCATSANNLRAAADVLTKCDALVSAARDAVAAWEAAPERSMPGTTDGALARLQTAVGRFS